MLLLFFMLKTLITFCLVGLTRGVETFQQISLIYKKGVFAIFYYFREENNVDWLFPHKIIKTFPGPIRSYIVKKSHISPVVSEI